MTSLNKIFQGDRVIWIVYFLLCMISLVEVYSAASTLSYKTGDFIAPLLKQILFLTLGTSLCVVIHKIPCRFFKVAPLIFWPLCIFLLVFTMIFSAKTNGGARWIELPGGFTFQPSELAKGVLITMVAVILGALQTKDGIDKKAAKYVMIFTAITCGLIVTENLSTAGILFSTIFLMMFVARVPYKQLGKIVLGVLALGAFTIMMAYTLPEDSSIRQKVLHRFDTWESRLSNSSEKADGNAEEQTSKEAPVRKTKGKKDFDMEKNAQEGHAYIAIASGGFWGKMPGNSVERDYLSQAYSDFIYAIIIEELGWIGGFFVAFLYIVLLFRAGRIASRCERNFPAFLCMGLAILLTFQATINMMVAVGLFPVTGQPLPLISRGGTATIINCAYFGMILSVSRYARRNKPEEASTMLGVSTPSSAEA